MGLMTVWRSVALPAALGLMLVSSAGPGEAQEIAGNPLIDIAYVTPDNPAYRSDYELVQRIKVLEQLKLFLTPLRLPRRLEIRTEECGVTNAFYEPYRSKVVICYEWMNWVRRLAPRDVSPTGVTRDSAIVGAFVQVVLHELGHAVIHLLRVPVFGREEDAADQIAGFLMLQFGQENAKRTLSGAAYFWSALSERSAFGSPTDFSDVHGTEAQRFYNYLCIAYGGDPASFQRYVDSGLLPKRRAETCQAEYNQIYFAFSQTIGKSIDFRLAREVQQREWLPPAPK